MNSILITGITGYTGSQLARKLLLNYDVYGLVREPIREEYIADIQDRLHLVVFDGTYQSVECALRDAHPETVYHLAACYTGRHGAEVTPKLLEANIILGGYLLEAMTQCGCSALIYASTIMAHYCGDAYRPLNLYAATKQAMSDLLAYYTDAGLLRAVTLVLSDTYGPGDHRPKVLNLISDAARKGSQIALSDGLQDYDLVHIDDVVRAFQMAGELLLNRQDWKNEIFQVCAQTPLTLRETIEHMLRVNNWTLDAVWGARAQMEREIHKAIRLYDVLPGWIPQVGLEDGLQGIKYST